MMAVDKRAREVEDADADAAEEQLLASMERTLTVAQQQVRRKQAELELAQRRVDVIKKMLWDVGVVKDVGEDDAEAPTGSMTDGIREYLQLIGKQTDVTKRAETAKAVEQWLIRKGYRTGAKNFYWSVYGALRAMKEVVGVMAEGETLRFAWREAMPKAPAGWRLVDFPRRTSLASRQRQTPIAVPVKTRGKGQ